MPGLVASGTLVIPPRLLRAVSGNAASAFRFYTCEKTNGFFTNWHPQNGFRGQGRHLWQRRRRQEAAWLLTLPLHSDTTAFQFALFQSESGEAFGKDSEHVGKKTELFLQNAKKGKQRKGGSVAGKSASSGVAGCPFNYKEIKPEAATLSGAARLLVCK